EPGRGFAISYIPKSPVAPHQAVQVMQYYMRAGSSFVPVPHGVLAGMFGRRPQPVVKHSWSFHPEIEQMQHPDGATIAFALGFNLKNRGPTIARDAYVSFRFVLARPMLRFDVSPDLRNWDQHEDRMGISVSVVSKDGYKL